MTKKQGGGGKLARTEVLTMRLDRRLRYLLEVVSRQQRRTVSSYIEFAISQAIEREQIRPSGSDVWTTVGSEAEYLWDVDEDERLKRLAQRYPHLLNFDEQVQLKGLT